jgi:hypothetical protein
MLKYKNLNFQSMFKYLTFTSYRKYNTIQDNYIILLMYYLNIIKYLSQIKLTLE